MWLASDVSTSQGRVFIPLQARRDKDMACEVYDVQAN